MTSAMVRWALVLSSLAGASACTEVRVPAPTGEVVIGNTVEAGRSPVSVRVSVTPRGTRFGGGADPVREAVMGAGYGRGPEKTSGRGASTNCSTFTTVYGFVHGMNEMGLSINGHALDLAVFQTPPNDAATVICKGDLQDWILGMHATVDDVVDSLRAAYVVGSPGGQWGVHDATKSIVIEYVRGELRIHDNTAVGVMTNDPTYDWHLMNLDNYAALRKDWYDSNDDVAIEVPATEAPYYPWATGAYDADPHRVPSPIGHAYNLLGLPGDGSPPARFVRVFFLRQYAVAVSPPQSFNDTLILAQELLNSVYKVLGTIPGRSGAADPLETSPTATLKVPARRVVYTRSREDLTWRMLDLSRLDFAPRDPSARLEEPSVMVASTAFNAIDVTDELLLTSK